MNYITIQRTVNYSIEIIDRSTFDTAIKTYWKERNTFKKPKKFFLQHLALLAEQGFIKDEIEKFGVCVRVENSSIKIK